MKTDNKTRSKIASIVFSFLSARKKPCSISEMANHVASDLNLTEAQKRDRYKTGDVKYINMIRFALFTFKEASFVENVSRGYWSITKKGRTIKAVSEADYLRLQRQISRENNKTKRAKVKKRIIQSELFSLNKKENTGLSEKEIALLSEIVRQNNLIIEKLFSSSSKA